MPLFQPPPRTRYDLNFTLAGIPVRVHPLFWVIALLLGSASGGIIHLLIWVVVVFISILIHELGHSLAMRMYGLYSYIVLHLSGGLAVPESSRRGSVSLTVTEQIVISLAGPCAGFLLAGLVIAVVLALGGSVFVRWLLYVIPLPEALLPNGGSIVNSLVRTLLWVNLFWGFINLMPVFPLDGGNVARLLFIQADPWDGVRKSLWLSAITGAIVAVVGLVFLNSVFMALLFGFLAFQSYQTVRGRGNSGFW